MNDNDRKKLDDIRKAMDKHKATLEEIQLELEDRSLNLDEHFPGKAEVLSAEADRAMDALTSLEELIQMLEDICCP